MATLTGLQISQSYLGLIHTSTNSSIADATNYVSLEDGDGEATGISIHPQSIRFGNPTNGTSYSGSLANNVLFDYAVSFDNVVRLMNAQELRFENTFGNTYGRIGLNSGGLQILETGGGNFFLKGQNLLLQNTTGSNYIQCNNNGSVRLFHNGSSKLSTQANGVNIAGTLSMGNNPITSVATPFNNVDAANKAYVDNDSVSQLNGIKGNVQLLAGSNVTITNDTQNKQITIASTGGGGGGSIPVASATVLGGVKVPQASAINIDSSGNIDVDLVGTQTTKGLVKVQTINFTDEDGEELPISLNSTNTNNQFEVGLVSNSSWLSLKCNEPDIEIEGTLASTTQYGAVKIGSGLSVSNGVISTSGGGGTGDITIEVASTSFTFSPTTQELHFKGSQDINFSGNLANNNTELIIRANLATNPNFSGIMSGGDFQGNLRNFSGSQVLQVSNNLGTPQIWVNNWNGVTESIFENSDKLATCEFVQSVVSGPSDYRLKDNIEILSSAFDVIDNIKVYSFDWNDKAQSTGNSVGVLAHELQEIIPEAVLGDKDLERENGEIQPQIVYYQKLVPYLIKAVQELKQEIDNLKQN